MQQLGAILLIGGTSSRMGRDKAALNFMGTTFADLCARKLSESASCLIVASHTGQLIPNLQNKVVVNFDSSPDQGPLRGILDGLMTLGGHGYTRALVWPCDCPLVTTRLLTLLAGWVSDHDAAVPIIDGQPQPLNACYHTSVAGVLEAYLSKGGRMVREFCQRVRTRWIDEAELVASGVNPSEFRNINTPQEYEQLTRMPGRAH